MAKREKTKHKGIYRRGENYYVTFYVGPKKVEKVVGPRLSDALQFKIEMEGKARRDRYAVVKTQEKMTFSKLVDRYLNEGDGKKYITQFIPAYLNFFGGRKLSQIRRKDLFTFRDALKATPKQRGGAEVKNTTINRALAGLRRLFHFGMAEEYLEESPFPKWPKSGLFYPEQRGLRNFFTEKQMEMIIGRAPGWLKPMIIVSYCTGLRLGELLALEWEWIDLEAGVLYLPYSKTMKDPTGRGQRVVLQRALVDLFRDLPQREGLVFCQGDGERFKHWHLHDAFQKVLRTVGIDEKKYSWKELRHTTATLMKLKGAEISSIKDQLRHTSIKTTENFYIGSDIDFQREQIERLTFTSGKIVEKEGIDQDGDFASA